MRWAETGRAQLILGPKWAATVEINQVRVGIIDLTSQTTAYLHEDEDSRIQLVGTIRHQATMLSSIRSSMILIKGLVGTQLLESPMLWYIGSITIN